MSNNKKAAPAPSTLRRQAALAFGSALRAVRIDRGVSQMNLAASSALDPTYVSLMERGHRVPSFIVIVRLADALNVSPIQLFADGVARLPRTAPVETKVVYGLARILPNGHLVELEGVYSDFVAAMRNAQLQNIMRRKTGNPEITHVVEYLRTNAVDLGTRTPR
jgi:transcriptional regulator with XRE-family HTH domain